MSGALLCFGAASTGLFAAQVTMTWTDNSSNESGFRVERATGSGTFAQIATTGANVVRYVDTTVAPSTTYRYRVRAYNSAGNSGYSNIASITTGSATTNTAPTISAIANQSVNANGATAPLAFRISDTQTAASSLTLIRNSSNQSLLPLTGITFGGSGNNRTVTLRPASNQLGISTVWIKVSDGSLSSYISFVLTVKPASGANVAPTISAISNRTIAVNGTTGPIAFTIGDSQTAAYNLSLIRNVSNTAVAPLANVTFGGSGANRTVTVRPSANRTGWSTVWVKVSDGQLQSYRSFVVQVVAALTYAQLAAEPVLAQAQATSTSGTDTGSAAAAGELQQRFGHMPLLGDSEMTIRVEALGSSTDELRAGLMYRSSTAADAASAAVYVTGGGRLVFASRASDGATLTSVSPFDGRAPAYLRLMRSGSEVYAFTSGDGTSWELVEYARVALPATALGGTIVQASGPADAAAVTFSPLTVD